MDSDKKTLSLRGEKTRKKICETSLELFSKNGYSSTTVSEIAELAGIAEGTVYIYYKNKDELMLHSKNRAIEIIMKEIDSVLKKEKNPLAKFYAFFEVSINVLMKRPDLARFIVLDQPRLKHFSINDPAYTGFKDWMKYIKEFCNDAIQKGYLREIDIDILAFECHSMVDNLFKLWIASDYTADLHNLKNKMLEVLMYGLVP